MDSALILRKRVDAGEVLSECEVRELLDQSPLVNALLIPLNKRPDTFHGLRSYEWRMLELCEIPYVHSLPIVQEWLNLLIDRTAIAEGFSLTGNRDGVMACHTAMLTRILIKMQAEKTLIDRGMEWILRYQMLRRGEKCTWTGSDLYTRWGGCMKNTPCYYGIVKAMATLQAYQERFGQQSDIQEKLSKGLQVMLEHHLYQRLSTGEAIEPSIVENFYPYPYKTNLIEMLGLMKANGLLNQAGCQPALEILRGKRRKDGVFQADKVFMKSAWVLFDALKQPGDWISYQIDQILDGEEAI